MRVASSPHDFKLLVAGEGRTATSMDDLAGRDEIRRVEPTPRRASPRPARLRAGAFDDLRRTGARRRRRPAWPPDRPRQGGSQNFSW